MPSRRVPGAGSAGFALLEAVVALTVFAGAATALYGLFNADLAALQRTGDAARQMSAAWRAVEYLSATDPREEPEGRIRFDGLDAVWSTRLLRPPRRSRTAIGNPGYFDVGLYEVEFSLHDDGRSIGTWRMRVAGYEKVRGPSP